MNTPPRSELPGLDLISTDSSRLKRTSFDSIPLIRPFGTLDDANSKDLEVDSEKVRQLQEENEVRLGIARTVAMMDDENWLMRGSVGFSRNYSNL